MKRVILAAGVIVLTAGPVCAQSTGIEPPRVGQPANFSHVVGTFRISAEAAPTTVAVEAPCTLTVTITGKAEPPYVPSQDKLRVFPEGIERDFFIEPVEERAAREAWVIVYRLRPKHEQVKLIPSLSLVYYAPRQRRYQTAYSEAIPLSVTPARAPDLTAPHLKVVQAPPTFFELSTVDTSDGPALSPVLQTQLVLGVAILPPILCGFAVLVWRRRRKTDAARQRAHHRLLEETLSKLMQANSDPARAAQMLGDYLRSRFGFPSEEATPADVERWLKRRGVSKHLRRQWRELLGAYDASRFATGIGDPTIMEGGQAISLIRRSEDELCASAR